LNIEDKDAAINWVNIQSREGSILSEIPSNNKNCYFYSNIKSESEYFDHFLNNQNSIDSTNLKWESSL
jgi:hypothetical protein